MNCHSTVSLAIQLAHPVLPNFKGPNYAQTDAKRKEGEKVLKLWAEEAAIDNLSISNILLWNK
jgi:hypothetical protein